ncbi:MAG TPA: GFA family protein [Stellaceae bacterium]|nr:GFA family protein [Stellaceae bacterium]
MLQTYEGGCHCGRVRFRIRVDLAGTSIGECNCSICTKKAILHLPVANERLELLSGADDLATYTFNTGTAQHTFCRHCGIHAFYRPRSDPENYSVNARCLDDYDPETMPSRRLFDGREWESHFAQAGDDWAARR